jgi:hypothetical protein
LLLIVLKIMWWQPDMSGFLSWYARRCGEWRYPYELAADEHHKVMHAHTPRDLPVLRYRHHDLHAMQCNAHAQITVGVCGGC